MSGEGVAAPAAVPVVPLPAAPPVLRGALAHLEPLRLQHAAELWPAAADEPTWRHMSRRVRTPEDLAAWVDERIDAQKEGRALAWLQRTAVACAAGPAGTAVGCTALFDHSLRDRHAEVGHTWLAPAARGTGLNADSKRHVLGYAFDTLGLERVQLRTDAENARSRRAILGLGATFEGVLRRHRRRPDGTWRDTAVYSVLREEWPRVARHLDERVRTVASRSPSKSASAASSASRPAGSPGWSTA